MKSKTRKRMKYTDEPMNKVVVIADFLPSPEQLAFKEETVKITIALRKSSLDFFKEKAEQHHTPYQKGETIGTVWGVVSGKTWGVKMSWLRQK